MLTPQQLLEIVDTMYPLLDELNGWITMDLIRRLMARMGRGEDLTFGASDKWQLELYKSAGGHYEELTKKIKEWTEKSDDEVKSIFEDAGLRAWNYDDAFYVAQGFESVPLLKSESLMKVLVDTYQRTNGEIHNFTRTTAERSQQRFMNVCDKAHLKVVTGAQSYSAAVKEAVDELVEHQTQVRYPSGHVDTIETAVLRCVRTGTAQASGNLAIQGMVEHGWDVILVSAHLGARYGDGGENPGNHFWWQGKLYSREGKTEGLPDFVESTGYGTGEGLSGWNCRHSFGPGTVGHNPYKDIDSEENRKAYDLSQKQRAMERSIRHGKLALRGYKTAVDSCEDEKTKQELQESYDRTAERLRKQNAAYNQFCEENDLKRYDDRLRIAKWSRSEAAKAAKASTPTKARDVEISRPTVHKAVRSTAQDTQQATYTDVTQQWRDSATPNSHVVEDAQEITIDGATYTVDGHNVVLDYSPHEKEIAELLEKEFGGELKMMPRVNNPQGVSTPDYLFRGEGYDLKTIGKTVGKNPLVNRVKKAKGQSNNFVFDISNSELAHEKMIEQIEKLFTDPETLFAKTVMIANAGKIESVFERQ